MAPELYPDWIPADIGRKYEFYSYGHAIEILVNAFVTEWKDLLYALRRFYLTEEDILISGGNKSTIPKRFDDYLFPLGWREIRITGDLTVRQYVRSGIRTSGAKTAPEAEFVNEEFTIKGYIDGHNIDYIKNKVAFDLEWNSKDQTFDRDLLAMRTYFDCGIVDVGVIATRAENLDDIFSKLAERMPEKWKMKYGASTTHIDKLLPRLESRRQGGCPILAVGISKECFAEEAFSV